MVGTGSRTPTLHRHPLRSPARERGARTRSALSSCQSCIHLGDTTSAREEKRERAPLLTSAPRTLERRDGIALISAAPRRPRGTTPPLPPSGSLPPGRASCF